MKKHLLSAVSAALLLFTSSLTFGQSVNLGSAASFVIFSSAGAVSNTGISQITGNVGSNTALSTAFGNVNGIMHDMDAASTLAATDLLIAYNMLKDKAPTNFPATPIIGNGTILNAGVYSIPAAATLNLELILDAQNNPSAEFIFKIGGAFATNPSAKVKLVNGALACNVFWMVEGQVTMAAGTKMRGTIVANNGAISMSIGDTLEGRILTTAGAVTVSGVLAYLPVGCGSPVLTGPVAPNLRSAECYSLFTASGALTNNGISNITGSVGTNVGAVTGFNPLLVSGTIHNPDASTATCAADLLLAYNYLNTLPVDIELLYPAQFGKGLVLTPHTYRLTGATALTDTVYLNALGNANAVFVLQLKGALSTSTFSKVLLINGAQAKNVYWMVEGAVSINDNSIFRGTIVCNGGALGAINSGVVLDGRALLTVGELTTTAVTVNIPTVCSITGIPSINKGNTDRPVNIYPNPFKSYIDVVIDDSWQTSKWDLRIYNLLGKEIIHTTLRKNSNTLNTSDLPSGIYFYKVIINDETIQTGKLVSE